jgi:aspartate carbamoyltransferase catalytic subunit
MLMNLFYEPSTRTRFSFSAAAHYLGMTVIDTENAKQFSSAVKGESLEDTIRVLSEYQPSVIVLRHDETGSAARAAHVSTVPIINAGDGTGEHPTQALLDLYTISRGMKHVDGLTLLIGGDLARSRTVRSLLRLLSLFKVRCILAAPPGSACLREDIEVLRNSGVDVEETNMPAKYLPETDIIYWTRAQHERAGQLYPQSPEFTITGEWLTRMKDTALILHPLPRTSEISTEIDSDPRAAYFWQAGNGVLVRIALLEYVRGHWS